MSLTRQHELLIVYSLVTFAVYSEFHLKLKWALYQGKIVQSSLILSAPTEIRKIKTKPIISRNRQHWVNFQIFHSGIPFRFHLQCLSERKKWFSRVFWVKKSWMLKWIWKANSQIVFHVQIHSSHITDSTSPPMNKSESE